jgi:hypothetical protein
MAKQWWFENRDDTRGSIGKISIQWKWKGPNIKFHSTGIDRQLDAGNVHVYVVIVSEDAIVGLGWRLTQLSLTPAPSLLSTSASSEPFSGASCSCSEDGAESTDSLATAMVAGTGAGANAGAMGGVGKGRGGKGRDAGAGAKVGGGGGAGGSSADVADGDIGDDAGAEADARFRVKALWAERR